MKVSKSWKEITKELRETVAYISGNAGRRAFSAVVVEIRNPNLPWSQEPRRVTLRTSGARYLATDKARCQRFCRRLRKLGVKFNTSLGDCRDSIGGTFFAYRELAK